MTPSETVLSVDQLTLFKYSQKLQIPLVQKITFEISQKRIMGLIGASGCGKSLTCLAVMGLLPYGIYQISGSIRFCEEHLNSMSPSYLQVLRGDKLAMILQNPMTCFDPVFTIQYHFTETIASHKRSKKNQMEKIRTALMEVGFETPDRILSLYPFQMSGGMLQRVMIALALMMNVKLLIADEPTTDLDVVSQRRILNLLARMRDEHDMSILLVTHDLSVIAHLADEVMVMHKGEIVEQGAVKQIFNHSRHPYTLSLLQAHLSLYDDRLNNLFSIYKKTPEKKVAVS
jgi:nickel transport system ATP-binding protein